MKDLYGLREEQVIMLKKLGLVDEDAVVYGDGKSVIDGTPLYVISFPTSEDQEKAYNVIFGNSQLLGYKWPSL